MNTYQLLFFVFFGGCTVVSIVGAMVEVVLEYKRKIDRLEAEIQKRNAVIKAQRQKIKFYKESM